MKAWVKTDSTGHIICSIVADIYDSDDMKPIEVDEDFDWSLQSDYIREEDGSLTYDGAWSAKVESEIKAAKRAEKAEKQRNKAISRLMQSLGDSLEDDEVYDYDCIVPEWVAGTKRKKGELVEFGGIVYRVAGNVNKNNDTKPGEDGGRYYIAVPKPEETVGTDE